MNKLSILFFSLAVFSCTGKYRSDAREVKVNPTQKVLGMQGDTLWIDAETSTVDWVVTEMRGTRIRTGTIAFRDGFLTRSGGEISGVTFVIDMHSMEITDMPVYEKIARKNLLDHLKSRDFFHVDQFPVSRLVLTGVEKGAGDSLKISGNLSIREVSKNIEFLAHENHLGFTSKFRFNRFDWNIAYQGSWAEKTLIDRDIELNVQLRIK